MRIKLSGLVFAVIFMALFSVVVVFAQSEEPAGEEVVEAEAEVALEGIEVAEPTSVPSNFGLWWRELRERISIAFTLNPVKKAEKQLKFAEERMNLAKVIMEKSEDSKIQEKAQIMLENAERLMAQIEEKKAKWEAKGGEPVQRLMRNIATHQIRKEKILDVIEEKVPVEKQEQFQLMREKMEQNRERLMNAIENSNAPEVVKEHLQNVKERIEAQATVVNQYRGEKKKLLEKIKTGDTAAKEEFKQLQAEKMEKLRAIRVEYKENMPVVESSSAGGESQPASQ